MGKATTYKILFELRDSKTSSSMGLSLDQVNSVFEVLQRKGYVNITNYDLTRTFIPNNAIIRVSSTKESQDE